MFFSKLTSKYTIVAEADFKWEYDSNTKKGQVLLEKGSKKIAELPFSVKNSILHLEFVGVSKKFRGEGLATKALSFLKEKAKEENLAELSAEITWTGAYAMMKKVFGSPFYVECPLTGEISEEELLDELPTKSPEDIFGSMSGSDYISVWWRL